MIWPKLAFTNGNKDFEDVKGTDKDIRNTHLNIGTGEDIAIKDLAELIKKTVAYQGSLGLGHFQNQMVPHANSLMYLSFTI